LWEIELWAAAEVTRSLVGVGECHTLRVCDHVFQAEDSFVILNIAIERPWLLLDISNFDFCGHSVCQLRSTTVFFPILDPVL
jgi:hypothetical protein